MTSRTHEIARTAAHSLPAHIQAANPLLRELADIFPPAPAWAHEIRAEAEAKRAAETATAAAQAQAGES